MQIFLECPKHSAMSKTIYHLCACNFLEGGRDDEISVVHGNQVCRELSCKVVVFIHLPPENQQRV